jgi:hypothetical protein
LLGSRVGSKDCEGAAGQGAGFEEMLAILAVLILAAPALIVVGRFVGVW